MAQSEITLTDDQANLVDSFKDVVAGWLCRYGDDVVRALVASGLPAEQAVQSTADAVEQVVEQGWHAYLRALTT